MPQAIFSWQNPPQRSDTIKHVKEIVMQQKVARYASRIALTLLFLLPGIRDSPAQESAPRILEVDRLGTTPYKTLAEAARVVQPGDTIRVKPNTGPYREELWIKASGTEQKPIVFDGGNNVITGFEPLTTWQEKDGVVTCPLKTFPCVLVYKGERLVQDTTGQYTKYVQINAAKDTLTLLPGAEKTGWEVSTRAFAVHIVNVSHQVYRNVRASGSTNDGFNLHGTGTGLAFENIEGFHNLDEGFSTHDGIISTVRKAKFWGNDNGIANSYLSKDILSSTFIDTDVYDNLGFGLILHDCSGKLKNVRIWHNGLRQLIFNNAAIDCENVSVYAPKHKTRQYVTYTESKDTTKMITYAVGQTAITGTPPTVIETSEAP
jgi:hypothetical protein